MIPTVGSPVLGVEIVTQPSKTYKWDPTIQRIGGIVNGIDAIIQAANLMLLTARYGFPIFSGDYGEEVSLLISTDPSYAKVEVKRRIKEVLTVDDRITNVINFVFTELDGDSFEVTFEIVTIEGVATMQTGVTI